MRKTLKLKKVLKKLKLEVDKSGEKLYDSLYELLGSMKEEVPCWRLKQTMLSLQPRSS